MTDTATTETRLAALIKLGTSVWLDFIKRSTIESGELERLVREDSVVGETSNPSIFEKAIIGSDDYDKRLRQLDDEGLEVPEIYETIAVEDVQAAADIMRSVYDETEGLDGYVSLEVAPSLAIDIEGTVEAAARLWKRLDRPNVMIKIPGNEEGLDAIRRSIASGINVNATLLFAVDAYKKVADAYISGLEDRAEAGEPIDKIASVASFFVSRIDTAVDKKLDELNRNDLAGKAAVANAQVAYAEYLELFQSDRFKRLSEKGAKWQRVLWASTSTKNPEYSDVKYIEELAGKNVVNTMPLETLEAFRDHGEAEDRLSGEGDRAKKVLEELNSAGVDFNQVTDQLLEDGIESFAQAMEKLLQGVENFAGG